ncbi:MAG: SEC-C metal-binding domain-containing protein [Acidimicrobiales bacterium]
MDDRPDLDLLAAALEVLSEGPLPMPMLVDRLRATDAFAAWGPLDDDQAAIVLDEVLITTDESLTTEDDLVVLLSALIDGSVFTHRVAGDELAHGVLHETPDLVLVNWDDQAEVSSPEGELTIEYPLGLEDDVHGVDEHGSMVGPTGWLAGVAAGDLVALRRRGRRVEVTVVGVDEVADGEAEVEAIRQARTRIEIDGVGTEPIELVLDAVAHDPSLFRSPVAPVGELFERAGLRRAGAFVGPVDSEWEPPGVRWRRQRRADIEAKYQFDRCCTDAFDRVLAAWEHVLLSSASWDEPASEPLTDLGGSSARDVARALDHGPVAPALADWVIDSVAGSPLLDSFATALIESGPAPHPGSLFLRATNAEADGRVIDAEVDFTAALVDDPTYAPAIYELARFASDRGDINRAIALYRRVGEGAQPEVDFLSGLLPDYSKVGRNNPCPCGSGRKFKQCHQDNPEVPADRAALWLFQKLLGFGYREPFDVIRQALAEAAVYGALPDEDVDEISDDDLRALAARFKDEPFLLDLAVFESGIIERFAEERSVLLPPGEADMLQAWIATDRRLWEVTEVEPGHRVTFRDTVSGDVVEIAERTASQSVQRGDLLLARVVPVHGERQLIGQPVPVSPRQRSSVVELLDDHADAADWAHWFGQLLAPPAMRNREDEDLIVGAAVVRTSPGVDVAALLDAHYAPAGAAGRWADVTDIDGEQVVRASLDVEDDGRIVITAGSDVRMDRVLDVLRLADPGLVVEGDERKPFDSRKVGDLIGEQAAQGTTTVDPDGLRHELGLDT